MLDKPSIVVTTAPHPGAIAIVQLQGQGARAMVQQFTKRDHYEDNHIYFTRFADIDEGLTVCRNGDWVQLMPHGGPRVVQKLCDALLKLGAQHPKTIDTRAMYPEADSDIEADMLAALAECPSPAAIDLLLAQPSLWRKHIHHPSSIIHHFDHLLHPPTIVVAGEPNVGKSTLTNAILGRTVSVVHELPGATRDWVGSFAELNGIAVRWLDTPGIRQSDDPVEQRAIQLATEVVRDADVLIAMRTASSQYPKLPREADLHVINQVDDASPTDEKELPISALHNRNLDALQQRIVRVLKLDALSSDMLWAFSPTLRKHTAGEPVDIRSYVGEV